MLPLPVSQTGTHQYVPAACTLPISIQEDYSDYALCRLDTKSPPLPYDLCWVEFTNGVRIFGIYLPHELGADFEQPGRVVRAREYIVLGVLRRGRGWCEG